MKKKLDKLIASRVALYESSKELRYFNQDVVLCSDPEDLLEIHVYQGIEKIAEMYDKEVVIETGNTFHLPSHRHKVEIKVGDYTITFFQLKEVERNKMPFEKLLLENEELKNELEMLKSGSQCMRNV